MKMNSKAEIKEILQKLIDRGVRITVNAEPGNIRYADDPVTDMHDAFSEYHLWKHDVRMFFLKYGDEKSASYFFEGDNVPFLKGGIEYSYIDSDKSQTLLKNIRETTSERLKYLRDIDVQNLKLPTKEERKNMVESLFVVQPEKDERIIKVIVNEDYLHPVKVNANKRTWTDLLKIACDGSAGYFKPTLTYLNSSTANVIYKQTGLNKTKILESHGDLMYPSVKVEVISQLAFSRRCQSFSKLNKA